MARPPATPGVLLTHTISVRVDEDCYNAWTQKVMESKLSNSEFFRQSVIRNKTVIIATVPAPDTKQRLVFIFSKASNNINQLAHRANLEYKRGILGEENYEHLLAELAEIRRIMFKEIYDADPS